MTHRCADSKRLFAHEGGLSVVLEHGMGQASTSSYSRSMVTSMTIGFLRHYLMRPPCVEPYPACCAFLLTERQSSK